MLAEKGRKAAMTGQRIGYKRVSTIDQSTARQLDGERLDKVFEDKLSGKDRNRPQLELCLEFLREGDTLVVHSLDRLGRNVRDLLDIVGGLTARKVTVQFLHPALAFSGDDSPINKLLFLLLAGFAEMERSLILERQREGVALAKKAGRYKGRAPAIRAGNGKSGQIEGLIAVGTPVAETARVLGVSRQTVYSWLKDKRAAMAAAEKAEQEAGQAGQEVAA
jgi:DNA invertase Pin-like site-specific DNA recombinase